MTAISWKGVTGDWSTAGDWTGGKVPTSSDDVTIAVPGGYTVTISKASSAKSFNLNDANATIADVASLQVTGTLNVLAGAFDLGTGGSVSAALVNVGAGALLKKSSGTGISNVSAKLVNAGTVLATSGTLQFTGGGQFAAAGSLAGNGGIVDLNAGTFSLAAATAKFDGGVLIDGFADINIGAGKILTMAGANTFNTGNGFDGSGTLITTGTVTAKAGNVGGTAVWRDTGTVIQTGNFEIQSTATIATAATTGIWDITGDFSIPFSGDGTFINAGLLEKTTGVGTSEINAFLVNTGTVVARSGTLRFTGGGQFGATGSVAGNGGTIEFNTGTFSLASATAKISGGALFDGFLTVEINAGQTLTLAGIDTVNAPNGTIGGSGTLLTTGTVTTNGAIIAGHATWLDNATVLQNGGLRIDNTATIATGAAGKWNITTDAGIPFSGSGTFANAGLLEKTVGVGTSTISAYLWNTGTVLAKSGTLQFTGGGRFGAKDSVAGNGGTVDLNSGIFTLASTTAAIGGGLLLDGFAELDIGAGQTLTMAGTNKLNSSSASIVGHGTLLTTGTVMVAAGTIDGTATWLDSGTVLQTDSFSISGGATITTAATTGTWNIRADAGLPFSSGGAFVNDGLLEKTAGTGVSAINAYLTNVGTVLAASGTLQFTGGGQFGATGTVIGTGGTVDLNSGSFSLASPTAVIGGGLLLDGFAVIDIGAGQTLTAAGKDTVKGDITGNGTWLTTGTVTVLAGSIGGRATWLDDATVLQTGDFSISDTATIATTATGTWNVTKDAGMPFSDNGTFANAGVLEKTAGAGVSAISGYLWNSGTVLAKSGTLRFTGGGEFATTGSIAGSGGTVDLNSGVFTLASATATIGGGVLLSAFGQIDIGAGQALTMAGADTIDASNGGISGAGTLVTPGTVTVQAGTISGTATWQDTGTVLQTDDFSIEGGATITTSAAGTWDITSDAGMPFSSSNLFINAGLLEKTAGTGTSTISAAVVNNGTVMVSTGTLDLDSAIDPTSSGVFQLNGHGSLEIAAIIGSASKIQFLGAAPTNRLIIDSVADFGIHVGTASYTGPLLKSFIAGDVIDLRGVASTGIKLTYSAATGNLQIAENGSAVGTLRFENSTLGAGTFHPTTDGSGGSLITHS